MARWFLRLFVTRRRESWPCDDTAALSLSMVAAPPLPTVRSLALEHGHLAREMLLELIRGESVARVVRHFPTAQFSKRSDSGVPNSSIT